MWEMRPGSWTIRVNRFTLSAVRREEQVKFRIVFLLFNVVVVVSFLVIYLMPLAILGGEYTRQFWSDNRALPLLFAAILVALNTYFVFNWKLFTLLETEEWDGLIDHLEHRIYRRRLILAHYCRILINAYLVRSRLESIERLEHELEAKRPGLIDQLAMPLGVRYLLSGDPAAMATYFGRFAGRKFRDRGWVELCRGFAGLLSGDRESTRSVLTALLQRERNPVLLALALYLLETVAPGEHADEARRLRERMDSEAFAEEVERQRNQVQVVILDKLLRDAREWLYRPTDPAIQ
jgi:hypothetical protein